MCPKNLAALVPARLLLPFLGCMALVGATYHSRLNAFFFQDDLAMIEHGVDCWRHGDLLRLLSTDQYDVPTFQRLRPLVSSVFALVWSLAPFEPLAFRLLNLAAFTATAFVLFALARRFASQPVAWIAIATFVTWPSLSNAVFPVCTLTDVLAGCFSLLAALIFVWMHSAPARHRWWQHGLLMAVCLAALGSKETGIACGLLLVVAGCQLLGMDRLRALVAAWPAWIVAAAYLVWRQFAFGQISSGEVHYSVAPDALVKTVLSLFLELTSGLSFESALETAGPARTMPFVALCLVVLAGCAFLAVRGWRRWQPSPLARFGLWGFFATLAPVAYYPLVRNIYIPLACLSLLLGEVLAALWRSASTPRRHVWMGALLAILVVSRMGIIDTACRTNGSAGDLFLKVVTQLDEIALSRLDPNHRVVLLGTPVEVRKKWLIDMPWILCGSDVSTYQRLKFGTERAKFLQILAIDLFELPAPGDLRVTQNTDQSWHVEFGPNIWMRGEEFHRSHPAYELTVRQSKARYRFPQPTILDVRLSPEWTGANTTIAMFDGAEIRRLK